MLDLFVIFWSHVKYLHVVLYWLQHYFVADATDRLYWHWSCFVTRMAQNCWERSTRRWVLQTHPQTLCLLSPFVSDNHFHRASSYASAVLGVVILSVCLSVTRAFCDKIKHCTADILIPHERAITLSSFLTPTVVGGRRPLPSEICAQNDQPLRKTSTDFRL